MRAGNWWNVGLGGILWVGCGGPEFSDLHRPQEVCEQTYLDFEVEGYGEGTRGGWVPGADTYCVTSLGDRGEGSLREALATDGSPRVVVFGVDGEITLSSPLAIPSHISVDGRGRDIRLRGKGMTLHNVEEVILTHVAIVNTYPDSEDGLQIGWPEGPPSHHIVIDHVSFLQDGGQGASEYVDEAISVIYGSYAITVSWCHFQGWEKIMLLGNGDAPPDVDEAITVTAHHNFFDGAGRRHPQARYGHFDFYNNYLWDWHMYNYAGPPEWHESFGAQCEDNCSLLFEANVVERHPHPTDVFSEANHVTRCLSGGVITSLHNWVTPESTARLRWGVHCNTQGNQTRPYEVELDDADQFLREAILAGAGYE